MTTFMLKYLDMTETIYNLQNMTTIFFLSKTVNRQGPPRFNNVLMRSTKKIHAEKEQRSPRAKKL